MALDTHEFGNMLKEYGFTYFSGVPCSFLNNLINYAINECEYIMSANEGDAVASCAGAYLAGRKTVSLMQNSGLGNAVSPLTSLNYSFQIPTLGFVSLRGEPGLNDEPQHELMGTITDKMLSLMNVQWEILSDSIDEARQQLERANQCIENHQPFFFIVKKNGFAKVELKTQQLKQVRNQSCRDKTGDDELPTRLDVLNALNSIRTEQCVYLATTGKTGRELYEIEDAPNYFYMVGSMGCISSLALGLAMNTDKNVIAIDGDGAFLMRMGSAATNAYYAPENMLHLLLDNNIHDSTGGQATVSGNIDFVQLAANTAYQHSLYIHSLDELTAAIEAWKKQPSFTFMYIRIRKGTKENLGRPKIKPYQVKNRLRSFLNGN